MLLDLVTEARAGLKPGVTHYATSTRKLDDGRIVTCRVTLKWPKIDPAKAKPRWFVNGVRVDEPPQGNLTGGVL